MDRKSVISYQPQKEKPQVLWLRDRVRIEELRINLDAYKKRKGEFLQRLKQMSKFVREDSECRSLIIGRYFGDEKIKACGVCDNCLRKKNASFNQDDFEKLLNQILDTVANEKIHTNDLLGQLKGAKKENAWKVIEFLQAENKLDVDSAGWVTVKK